MRTVRKRCIAIIQAAALLLPIVALAGIIPAGQGKTEVRILDNTYARIVFSATVGDIETGEVTTPAGTFTMLSAEGLGRRNVPGEPALPVYRKMIEVPVGAAFTVRIIRQQYHDVNLQGAGVHYPVFPAQPPMSKGDDPAKVPFVYDKEVYTSGAWIADELATVTYSGTLRAVNLARVEISPVQYNPAEGTLRIYDLLEAEIVFEHANIPATMELKRTKASPFFDGVYGMLGNYKPLSPGDELITASPVTYVIVSDPMFQSTLQPFIQWKQKKGFRVIEGYTSNPSVGNTTTSIKAWLQGLYNTPPSGYNVPSFVLFVGDVAQIPAWAGGAGSHFTDLRYCEYTNDNLPEVYYGRFSATTIAQLQPQIDKTLEYEQYLMPDPSFLNEAVMAAGADASYQTHSNGQIYYGTENYFNAAHGITSHTYLQPEPTGGNYSQNIKNNVSAGVAYANYTAHCSENGWANPSFLISDVAALTNAHKYCLMVGNCCLSCKFDVNSFAEEQLRAANKGSVGYIGGSNNTYWDEDYWWGCGFKTVVLHPAYDAAHIGAYDGTFHDHGEPLSDWFVTQGQMVVCGNYAVEESGSSRKQYYWEIYHLMGDPSLMVYYSVPPAMTATYQDPLMLGMTSLSVITQPYAYVALSQGGVLLDAKIADAAGSVTLNFTALGNPGTADLVITKQNRQPFIASIQIIPAAGPYVIYTAHTVSDPAPGGNNNSQPDYGETNALNVTLKNVGVEAATAVTATLATASPYVTVSDNTEAYGTIQPSQSVTVNSAFSILLAPYIPDQQVIPFNVQAVSGGSSWNSGFSITVNAPVLQAGVLTVQDTGPGCDNDGILDPGETANLLIVTTNGGHASVSNVIGSLTINGGSSPYLTIHNGASAIGTLAAGASGNAVFSVTADAATPVGTPVNLTFAVTGGATGQYSLTTAKQVVIGLIPVFNITSGSATTCTGYFYDTGGAAAAYQNNESITETFYPSTPGAMIRFTFESFSTEAGYDFLRIYNGTSTSAPLIGSYDGTTGPGTVTASNAAGALTFNFTSDVSVTPAGWEASVSCFVNTAPPVADFLASSLTPSTGQTVTFTDLSSPAATTWNWSFSPNTVTFVNGTGAASQNPQVQFNASGAYTVTLTAANIYGSNTKVKSGYITAVNCTVATFPWSEGFESGGVIPGCWSQEQISSSGVNWVFITGNGTGYPAAAHTGTYDACLKDNSSGDNRTRLISPILNLSNLPSPQLRFWHTQAYWSPDQDQLSVYYRTSEAGTWTLLATYTASLTAWTQETIALPVMGATTWIAFEGNAKYGRGVCIDDVEVSSSCATILQGGVTVTASANPVMAGTAVTFTATPANGGTTPSYQWYLNGVATGTNSPTLTYEPSDGDAVSCVMTSSASCVAPNPAASNIVVMSVTTVPASVGLMNITVTGTQCFNAVQTITVAGGGNTFTVTSGGNATLIAGQNILIYPGTVVAQGGYLYGYIAPGGPWCITPTKPVTAGQAPAVAGGASFFSVYPNPTTGHITLALNGYIPTQPVQVGIYGMNGQKVASASFADVLKHEFDLASLPPGLYLLKVDTGTESGTARIVKIE